MRHPGKAIGVIRRHGFGLASGPRLRLRAVLDGALSILEKRLGRSRPRRADHPSIDFIWNRPSPLLVLRENRVQQDWHISPTLFLNVGRPFAAGPQDVAARAAVPPSQAAALAPRLMRTVERRIGTIERTLERRIETRVVDRTLPVLHASRNRRSFEGTARHAAPASVPSASPPQPLFVRIAAPVARPEMVFARPLASAAVAGFASPTRACDSAAPPRSAAPATPQAPEMRLERITTEVVRALDARLIAWRERMGRS